MELINYETISFKYYQRFFRIFAYVIPQCTSHLFHAVLHYNTLLNKKICFEFLYKRCLEFYSHKSYSARPHHKCG
jgi:hypothetical protein